MSSVHFKESIDMRGKLITTYILYYAVQALDNLGEGEVLEIITDRFEAIETDIRAWSRTTGYAVLEVKEGAGDARYYIRKSVRAEPGKKFAMVISSAGLEELISPLGFALGAAVEGMSVSIYLQGPAVRVLKKGFKAKLGGLGRPFSGFARRGMSKMGHIPPQAKLRQLRELGAKFYLCGPSMRVFKVAKGDLIFDDVIVAEYMTFLEVMRDSDIKLYP